MPLPRPELGLVICYSYLWHVDYTEGYDEGIKDRPCAIVSVVETNEELECIVTVVPITHSPPPDASCALEIPAATKKRLGLDSARSWIILNEINQFLWPGPDLRPVSRMANDCFDCGFLPPDLFERILERMQEQHDLKKLKSVFRTE